MRNLILLGIAALALNPAVALAATDAEIVTEMATKCWTLPEGVDYQRASATFEVTYNSDGELSRVVTVDYQPVRKAGEVFAISAQQALMECANKTSVKSRTIRVVMRFIAPQSNGPLIMKRPLR
ncbi:hypothetical protein J3U99_11200 [Brucella pituitosa]|uniref:hypothetical protein n=1 Tax=Brucella pituitosa TaxID=571256 RepID=UPI000C2810EC|nr:hypothetical protein [Brucella pituitosa]MCK4205332.1 hypothetical protein [Brucella pituitosa]PJO49006.1 hypothetical protein CWE02_04235 [Brucella pituitosa]PRA84839.1 hypothetical protein CQ054_14595 [Ochrobactrum sp. MYb29]